MGVFEPKEGSEEQNQSLMAKVVAVLRDRMVPLHAVNLEAVPVIIYEGVTISKFFPITGAYGPHRAEYMKIPLSLAVQ